MALGTACNIPNEILIQILEGLLMPCDSSDQYWTRQTDLLSASFVNTAWRRAALVVFPKEIKCLDLTLSSEEDICKLGKLYKYAQAVHIARMIPSIETVFFDPSFFLDCPQRQDILCSILDNVKPSNLIIRSASAANANLLASNELHQDFFPKLRSACSEVTHLVLGDCVHGQSNFLEATPKVAHLELSMLRDFDYHFQSAVKQVGPRLHSLSLNFKYPYYSNAGAQMKYTSEETDAMLLAVIPSLCALRELTIKDFPNSRLGDEIICGLAEHCRNLSSLSIPKSNLSPSEDRYPSTKSMVKLITNLSLLEVLNVANHFNLSDRFLESLTTCAPRLRHIILANCYNMTGQYVDEARLNWPELVTLDLGHDLEPFKESFVEAVLRQCPGLRFLQVSPYALTEGLLKTLEDLGFRGTRIGYFRTINGVIGDFRE
ncbi:hypothetical protein BZG36_04743 [Bifiguratus adelaidae]|uniref:F-box domain-containing protein n=1 Tax=Bifiguratus adelaidae TaxID=1938954 RepID=A0A261XUT8_9FUNG|nr:hypothetical protein BZG36_04743 [Bifiguratus adelaidae]